MTIQKLHRQTDRQTDTMYTVSKNDTALACYNFDLHRPILIIFGRNVAKTVSSQMVPTDFLLPWQHF